MRKRLGFGVFGITSFYSVILVYEFFLYRGQSPCTVLYLLAVFKDCLPRSHIRIDIIRIELLQHDLTPLYLGVQGLKESLQHIFGGYALCFTCGIGNSTYQMGQIAKSVRKAAALHIYQHEIQLIRSVLHAAADNVGNQCLGFT